MVLHNMLNPFEKLSPEMGLALYAIALGIVAAIMCALALRLLLETGWAWRLAVDRPNARSLHNDAVPRCGGWGVIGTLLLIVGATSPSQWRLLVALVILAGVSFLDDRGGVPIAARFAAQIASVILVLFGPVLGVPWWLLLVCALAWLWSTNLYNFMDGADGMAGTMTVTGFAAYAAARGIENIGLTTVCVVASGSALGFLAFNRPPARLFLGDVGSIPLGFLAGAIGYSGWRDGRWPFWFPLLVFSPFVVDASVTLGKRLARRERVWQAHREHYYQRLIQSGLSHGQSMAIWGVVMVAAAVLALNMRRADPNWQWLGGIGWLLVLAALGVWIDRRWARSRETAMPHGEDQ
jgi:UDP-N-acetylmuramyl pentapeptide phosphotransferase/UDP-N-acetylglucosamine-1-phosphate transferase